MALSRKLLRDNPHIAAWHFHRRFTLFRDIVLKVKFNGIDYWVRYKWQGRGSTHCHGLYWMKGTPVADMEDKQARMRFAEVWGNHVSAVNPEPDRMPQDNEGNPLSVDPLHHPLTFR